MSEQHMSYVLFRKKDVFVYLVLIVFFSMMIFFVSDVTSGSKILVTIEGRQRYRFSIDESGRKTIESDGKHLMDLVIEDSDAYIEDSQCPLHLCERDYLSDAGVLVCIPQKVLITFEDEKAVQYDAKVDLVTR